MHLLFVMLAWAADPPTGSVGASLQLNDEAGFPQVVFALVDGPADRAGITAGDLVTAIDGADLTGVSIEESVGRIRGPIGSTVTLTVDHDGHLSQVPLVRADMLAIGTATAKTEAEVCPAYRQIWASRADFTPLTGKRIEKGDYLHGDVYASTAQAPGAAWTRLTSGLGSRVTVNYGPSPSRADAVTRMDALVRELRPCFRYAWFAREVDARGVPQVRMGRDHAVGWMPAAGGLYVTDANEVELYVDGGGLQRVYVVPPGNDSDNPQWDVLKRVLQTATDGFQAVRGPTVQAEAAFSRTAIYQARVALPDATACRVTVNLSDASYECVYREAGDAAVFERFEALTRMLVGAVGPGWVYWHDEEVGYGGRYALHFAQHTSHGREELPVLTVRAAPAGVSVWIGVETVD